MFTELNEKLKNVKERCRQKKKWEDHLKRAITFLQEEETKKKRLNSLLQKEKADVERLEIFSLANLLYSISGRKLEKLEREKQEVVAAKLKYQEADETVKDLKVEIAEYHKLIEALGNCDQQYKEILSEKERLIKDTSTIWTEELYELVDQETELQMMINDYEEAISAGKIARNGLDEAIKSLEKAKGWSTFDLFGGGMITTAIKHSHIGSAKDDIHRVQNQLRHFQDELLDIKNHFHIDLEIGNMLTFADYFFDGLIVDWMVHGKISDSLDQANNMAERVNKMMHRLNTDYEKLQMKLSEVGKERLQLLENA